VYGFLTVNRVAGYFQVRSGRERCRALSEELATCGRTGVRGAWGRSSGQTTVRIP